MYDDEDDEEYIYTWQWEGWVYSEQAVFGVGVGKWFIEFHLGPVGCRVGYYPIEWECGIED